MAKYGKPDSGYFYLEQWQARRERHLRAILEAHARGELSPDEQFEAAAQAFLKSLDAILPEHPDDATNEDTEPSESAQ